MNSNYKNFKVTNEFIFNNDFFLLFSLTSSIFSMQKIYWLAFDITSPKLTSFSSKREDLHEMYRSQKTNKIGEYTHGINLADNNLI